LRIEQEFLPDCALSRIDQATNSFLPSGVAPMITSRHCASFSRRACVDVDEVT
jgi:hypothetical protein